MSNQMRRRASGVAVLAVLAIVLAFFLWMSAGRSVSTDPLSGTGQTSTMTDKGPVTSAVSADMQFRESPSDLARVKPLETNVAKSVERLGDKNVAQFMSIDLAGHATLRELYDQLYELAASGDSGAQFSLAQLLRRCAVAVDPQSPMRRPDSPVLAAVEVCETIPVDAGQYNDTISRYLRDAARAGSVKAILEESTVVPRHVALFPESTESKAWTGDMLSRLQSTAESGNVEAILKLARFRANGTFVDKDVAIARALFEEFLRRAPANHAYRSFAQSMLDRLSSGT